MLLLSGDKEDAIVASEGRTVMDLIHDDWHECEDEDEPEKRFIAVVFSHLGSVGSVAVEAG